MRKLTSIGLLLSVGILATVFYVMQDRNEKSIEELRAEEFAFRKKRRENGYVKADKPHKLEQYLHDIKTPAGEDHPSYVLGYQIDELEKAKQKLKNLRIENDSIVFKERGPANVPGRTRKLVLDPEDASKQTWFAASVSGGIWKTTDTGNTWTKVSLDLPNMATSTLAISTKNPNTMYVGTGEGFGGVGMVAGNGVFRSNDKGKTWQHLDFTKNNPDFSFVNRLVIDPNNENTVVVVTNTSIQKTTDGGNTWKKVFDSKNGRVQDIVHEPTNFQIQYATVHGFGVMKSVDAGNTWQDASTGITDGLRFEIAVSPTRTQRLYLSAEVSSTQSALYISDDKATTWQKAKEATAANVDYMGGQGWFDNCVMVHPFDHRAVFVGGVNLWKVNIQDSVLIGEANLSSVRENGTEKFMDFVRVSGFTLWGGRLSTGRDVSKNTSVQIRFGKGKKQKAHRFTVPVGATSGVPAQDYTYRDYVEVPFEAWDTKNNRQLMVSFRDQANDGKFELIARDDAANILGREYMYVHTVAYDSVKPSAEIAVSGGHEIQQMYFLWPTLQPDFTWTPDNLPETNLQLNWETQNTRNVTTTNLTDAYEKFSKKNNADEYHPDQHSITAVITSESNKTFRLITTNDGGVYYSDNEGVSFNKAGNTMNTTQFYSVDKRKGAEDYMGGTQDNGTWKSPKSGSPTKETFYLKMTGGDGFGVVWHSKDADRMLASVYNNNIYRSSNHGSTWSNSTSGLTDAGKEAVSGFITRFANSKNNPDVVFALSRNGIWKSSDFGVRWKNVKVGDGFLYKNFSTTPDSAAGISTLHAAVSLADWKIVWAGSGMTNATKLFLSKDEGETFRPVQNFTDVSMGAISGLTTDPNDAKAAYALFSMRGKPKVVRTKDEGQTWQDLSGFGKNSTSSAGFPDVSVFSLVVFPKPIGKMWAGTEIGIFETNDDGKTWALRKEFPAVSVWDMKIVDNQVVIGTHGRGIWTADLPKSMHVTGLRENITYQKLQLYPNPATDKVVLDLPIGANYDINLYDLAGKSVLKAQKTGGKVEILLPKLPKGVYQVIARSEKGNFSQKLLIE